ncbi:pirin family protein [Pseudidiomarina gelatinasegens]|uniref:Pirin family protein n=1 Tax=Pseudidiomarina gelatinasegens TaxID=2487740 RepID=A0A451GEP8_9GAMM|nr:pirin family protein [Pseudidiomarina gelatinasegens]RWU11568.1 pirin family protein [Pseudidiomarina gelatinasegens]
MTRSAQETTIETCESEHLQHDASVHSSLQRQLTPQLLIHRILPQRAIRMIGPWCFLDHFGPVAPADYRKFDIAPHPHIGLQTITWLFSGQLLHQDSLGYEQPLRSGQLNLMTAGRGISHAEVADHNPDQPLHGLQLWCALPPEHEQTEPRFDHYQQVPKFSIGDCTATLIIGSYAANDRRWTSPALSFSPALALMLSTPRVTAIEVHLDRDFEYGIYVVRGQIELLDKTVRAHQLISLGSSRRHIVIELSADTEILVLGGEAFEQPVKMWWNFVSASQQRVEQAQSDWDSGHERFGQVSHYTSKKAT